MDCYNRNTVGWWLNKFISYSSGGKSEIKIPARAGSGESLLSGLWSPSQKGQEVPFLLCPHMVERKRWRETLLPASSPSYHHLFRGRDST